MKAYLILADGTVYEGEGIGSDRDSISEVVFNTSMTGYLEILTDPSYCSQSIVMTYPLIGNYGVCYDDMESPRSYAEGYIVREIARTPSNFRCQDDLDTFLKAQDIPGITGVDTRALTKKLRSQGTMNGMITRKETLDLEEVLPKIRAHKAIDVVKKVTCKEKKVLPGKGFKVALMDFGAKRNIARELLKRDCEVTVWPAYTSADEIIASRPDGIMLSNGPGDPKDCGPIIEEMKKLYDTDIPIFAICLGHQLMALAKGADTRKMKWGHRGANHPVKDLHTGRVYISSQNHGYVVADRTVPEDIAEVSFVNANDASTEGLHYLGKNIFTVQFHPEACPGPQDTEFLFDDFIEMMEVNKNAEE